MVLPKEPKAPQESSLPQFGATGAGVVSQRLSEMPANGTMKAWPTYGFE